jgi:hypothetical protein
VTLGVLVEFEDAVRASQRRLEALRWPIASRVKLAAGMGSTYAAAESS